MDLINYPAKGFGFPHIIRDDRNCYVEYTRCGGPICICTLTNDWRKWDEASPHVFAHFNPSPAQMLETETL